MVRYIHIVPIFFSISCSWWGPIDHHHRVGRLFSTEDPRSGAKLNDDGELLCGNTCLMLLPTTYTILPLDLWHELTELFFEFPALTTILLNSYELA